MLNKMKPVIYKNEPDFYKWLFLEYPDFYEILDYEINKVCNKRLKLSDEIINQHKEYFRKYCDVFDIKVMC